MYKMPIIAKKKGRPESYPLSAFKYLIFNNITTIQQMESQKFAVKIADLIGTYQKSGSKMSKADIIGCLQVSQRKSVSTTKPPLFLLYKTPEQTQYVSSMYPIPGKPDVYKIDWKGHIAFVKLTSDSATIANVVAPN